MKPTDNSLRIPHLHAAHCLVDPIQGISLQLPANGGKLSALMRSAVFMSLAYLAGVHGFAFFAPYLVLFAGAVHVLRTRQRRLAAATASI